VCQPALRVVEIACGHVRCARTQDRKRVELSLRDPDKELELVKPLGKGAMGVVWRARVRGGAGGVMRDRVWCAHAQHRASGVEVAVKQLDVKKQSQVRWCWT
jgi:hypothetical protein